MSRYQITGIIYIHIYRHEWVTGTLYVRISTQNIACSQHQINMERQRERKKQLLVLMTHEAKTTRCFRKTFYQHRHKGLFLKCPSLFDHFHPVAFCLSPLLGAWLHLRFSSQIYQWAIYTYSNFQAEHVILHLHLILKGQIWAALSMGMWYCIYIWWSRDKFELHSAWLQSRAQCNCISSTGCNTELWSQSIVMKMTFKATMASNFWFKSGSDCRLYI